MTLTEQQHEEIHERREDLERLIHTLVDEYTRDLTPEQDDTLRMQLTEEFRFWRRR